MMFADAQMMSRRMVHSIMSSWVDSTSLTC